MVLVLLTAIRILFGELTLTITTNHFCDILSYLILGSLVPDPLRTELKKLSVVVLITPSTVPVDFVNDLILPFAMATYCVGPTAPILSAGINPASDTVIPVKIMSIRIVQPFFKAVIMNRTIWLGQKLVALHYLFNRFGKTYISIIALRTGYDLGVIFSDLNTDIGFPLFFGTGIDNSC